MQKACHARDRKYPIVRSYGLTPLGMWRFQKERTEDEVCGHRNRHARGAAERYVDRLNYKYITNVMTNKQEDKAKGEGILARIFSGVMIASAMTRTLVGQVSSLSCPDGRK